MEVIRNDCFGYKYRLLGNNFSFVSVWAGSAYLQMCGVVSQIFFAWNVASHIFPLFPFPLRCCSTTGSKREVSTKT